MASFRGWILCPFGAKERWELQSFRDILEQIEKASLSQREKGERFEKLIRGYLLVEPLYADDFVEVVLWQDYPGRGGRTDTGIDLVARGAGGDLTAIQCKFYAPGTKIEKKDVDGFIAASGKKDEFKRRLFVSTSDNWTSHADETIKEQDPEVERLRAQDLDTSSIDWSQFSLETPGELTRQKPKSPRPYQRDAINDVIDGFEAADRGKLIMACGTGKTFTSLKLAEKFVPEGGTVLFMVPSISLLSQTVREWSAAADRPQNRFAVCSDVKVGRRQKSDSEDISVTDLAFRATTDGKVLASEYAKLDTNPDGLTVVFSTYQSIQAITAAQKAKEPLPEFDLIICDEAHRTTGVTLAGDDDSAFVRIHDNSQVAGKKRLYMTATPRVYGDAAKSKADQVGAKLSDMNDPDKFGDTFHTLSFGKAVEKKILTDYKVLVLAVDEDHVNRDFQGFLANNAGELGLEDAAKLIGCWNGLAKRPGGDDPDQFESDPEPMKRAVAFAGNSIQASKQITAGFNQIATEEAPKLDPEGDHSLGLQVHHVDGTFNVLKRNEQLDWLKADPGEGECRILSNAKCLSEGVDVPALDAVLFLAPRKSQVDVVQSVGRVMRRPQDGSKKYGYVILPIAVPSGKKPEDALADNDRYQVVWQVLQALRSHDDRLEAEINKLALTKQKSSKISVGFIGGTGGKDEGDDQHDGDSSSVTDGIEKQMAWNFQSLEAMRDAIFARIVEKVGDRTYWETWAKDIAKIAQNYITRIRGLIDQDNGEISQAFAEFLKGLQDNLNPQVDKDQAVEMLAQHMITQPIFDALFEDYQFSKSNPVSVSMQKMLDLFDLENLDREQRTELDDFYRSVELRAQGIEDPKVKQSIIKDLYETFFRTAFKEMADRLGIVYTPIEIVDFILNSADEALREHFGKGITDKDVHVLDPFTGTGTFIVRLIQSGLITPADLDRKFRHELHANEIVLLAYYVAAINIEEAFHGEAGGEYVPFGGIVLTDTFQMHEEDDQDEIPGLERFPENNDRVKRQKELPIRVIVGNPPYSVGQGSGNDDNQNLKYPHLDKRIEETYVEQGQAQNQRTLYDSYIRAIRLASDRLGDRGVICFVSNGGFLESNASDGLRKCLPEEFTQISVFNLRGNARTAGEQRRKEKGNVFDSGGRITIAITLLVKDPNSEVEPTLKYRDIGDYLSRQEKLSILATSGSFNGLDLTRIVPNENGDWLNQRDPQFGRFSPLSADELENPSIPSVFQSQTNGVVTSRDAWVYGESEERLMQKVSRLAATYEEERTRWEREGRPEDIARFVRADPAAISWSRGLRNSLGRGVQVELAPSKVRVASYRPFQKRWLYFDPTLNEVRSRVTEVFPSAEVENLGFYCVGMSSAVPFSVLMLETTPDFHVTGAGSGGRFFPRYTYIEQDNVDNLLDAAADDGQPYRRVDNITDEILTDYQGTYGPDVDKDAIFFYVYGLLHSPEYRDRFQADLKKMLPRIPKVENFEAFAEAGRELSKLHLGYETVDPWPLTIDGPEGADLRVKKMRYGKNGKEVDKTTIQFNDQITISGIPEEAHRYELGSRSAIDWVVERYQVKTDKKSGIANDPNDWCDEVGDPRYILDLVGRVTRVSMETMTIVDGLPGLEVLEG